MWTWMKQRSGSSSLSVLKLKSFISLVKRYAVHYTRRMSLQDLYGLCVNHTDYEKSLAVRMNQNQSIPGQITAHIFCVFSGMAVWKRLCVFADWVRMEGVIIVIVCALYCNVFLVLRYSDSINAISSCRSGGAPSCVFVTLERDLLEGEILCFQS